MNNTVNKTVQILKVIAASREGKTLSQLVRELEYPKSTVFNILRSLEELGLLRVSQSVVPVYRLGVETLQLGLSYLSQTSLDGAARPVLSQLCRQTNETVFLSVRSGTEDLVYVMKYLSDSEFQTISSIGTVRPLLSVAMGKAMLCALSDEQVKATVTKEMLRHCSVDSVRDPASLLEYLRGTREMGYVREETRENPSFATTVAVPVLEVGGQLAGAISVVIMHDPGNDERVRAVGRMAISAAMEISRALGFTGSSLYPAK